MQNCCLLIAKHLDNVVFLTLRDFWCMTQASLTKANRRSLKLIKKGSLTSVGVSSILHQQLFGIKVFLVIKRPFDFVWPVTIFFSDIPGNKKEKMLCMYDKDHLYLTRRDDLCTLQECLFIELESRVISLHAFVALQVQIKINLNYFVI